MLVKLMQWREIAAPSESKEITIPSDDTKYTSKVAAVRRKPTNVLENLLQLEVKKLQFLVKALNIQVKVLQLEAKKQ